MVRLRAALRIAFGIVRNWKLTLDILHLPPADGGQGLWMPNAYLWIAHASTSWRYLQLPTHFGLLQRTILRDWLAYIGVVHSPAQVHMLQLSPCSIRHTPWLAYSVKALSDLTRLRSGLLLTWQEITAAPLWNSRLFTVDNKAITCRYLIPRCVLRVRDLIDSDTWSVRVLPEYRGVHKLKPAVSDKLFGHLTFRGPGVGVQAPSFRWHCAA